MDQLLNLWWLWVPLLILAGELLRRNASRITLPRKTPAPATDPPVQDPAPVTDPQPREPATAPPRAPATAPTPAATPKKENESWGCLLVLAILIVGVTWAVVDGCKSISHDWATAKSPAKTSAPKTEVKVKDRGTGEIVNVPAKIAGDTGWQKAARFKLKSGLFRFNCDVLPAPGYEEADWEFFSESTRKVISKKEFEAVHLPQNSWVRIRALGGKPIRVMVYTY